MGPKEVLKTSRASSIRFQGLKIIPCGSMLCPPSAQTSASVALPSDSLFFLFHAASAPVEPSWQWFCWYEILKDPPDSHAIHRGPNHQTRGSSMELSRISPYLHSWLLLGWLIGSTSHIPGLFSKWWSSHTVGSVYKAYYLEVLRIFQVIECWFPFALEFFPWFLSFLSHFIISSKEKPGCTFNTAWNAPSKLSPNKIQCIQVLLSFQ